MMLGCEAVCSNQSKDEINVPIALSAFRDKLSVVKTVTLAFNFFGDYVNDIFQTFA